MPPLIFHTLHPIYLVLSLFGCMLNLQDLSSQSGIEPVPPALGAWSLNHWTTSEVPSHLFSDSTSGTLKLF